MTDVGIAGYGESCTAGSAYMDGFAAGVQAAIGELAPTVMGLDPRETAVVNARMDASLGGQLAAKSPIDIACWDIKGQAADVPVSTLLGGGFHESLPVFVAMSLGPAEDMAAYASRLKRTGYRNYQIKAGDDPDEDSARVRAVLDAVGNWDFVTCDANGGWTRAEALRMARALDGFDVFLEQPCLTVEEIADVRSRTRLPILVCEAVTGVTALVEIVRQRGADAINLKPTRVGGITKAVQVRDLAQALGLQLVVDEPGAGDIASASMLHLAASTRPEYLLATAMTPSSVHVAGETLPAIVQGRVPAITTPGLGIIVDESLLGAPLFTIGDD